MLPLRQVAGAGGHTGLAAAPGPNLAKELNKRGEFYDIPKVREKLTGTLKPLTDDMTNN